MPLTVTLQGINQAGAADSSIVALDPDVEAGTERAENSSEPTQSVSVPAGQRSPYDRWLSGAPISDKKRPPVVGVGETVPSGPSYYRRSELSAPPVMQTEPAIDVSKDARKGAISGGKMALRLFVSKSGEVDRAEIESSSSASEVEQAVVAAFLAQRFLPGEIDGVAVDSQVVFEIDFDEDARGSSRSSDQQSRWPAPAAVAEPATEAPARHQSSGTR